MWLLALVVPAVAAIYFVLVPRRSKVGPRSRRLGVASRSLVRIVAAAGQPRCEAVRDLETYRFEPHLAPRLPLEECTMAASCRCRHQSVPERRVAVRRLGGERRSLVRYELENAPRRWGPGRRSKDWIGWSNVNWNLWGGSRADDALATEDPTVEPQGGADDSQPKTAKRPTDRDSPS